MIPEKCPYCGRTIEPDMTECVFCRAQFPPMPKVDLLPSGDLCIAPFSYGGAVKKAMRDLKFHGARFNSESLACALAGAIRTVYDKDMDSELITSVPTASKAKGLRRYDQAELLARQAGKILKLPYRKLLKMHPGQSRQVGKSAAERLDYWEEGILPLSPEEIKGKKILLIDDVVTTGATLSACCRILRKNGAERVLCAVTAMAGEYRLALESAVDSSSFGRTSSAGAEHIDENDPEQEKGG